MPHPFPPGESGPSRRLDAVASLVRGGSRLADVGTGHGLLPLRLLADRRISLCIATERSPELLPAEARAAERRDPRLELRHGDGLRPLLAGDRLDTIAICGMGGKTIEDILDRAELARVGPSRLVLQPQSETERVRRALRRRGWRIVAETLVRERGRFYCVIAAEPGAEPPPRHPALSRHDLDAVGPCLVGSPDPLVRSFWECQRSRLESIRHGRPTGPGRRRTAAALARAERILKALSS